MTDKEPKREALRQVGPFENFADQVFETAQTEPAIDHWEWVAGTGWRAGEERESVKYALNDDIAVEIWRVKNPVLREETNRVEPFIEYWINLPAPIRLGLNTGAKVQRSNFHIGVCADGEYLQSPETMTLGADSLRTVLGQVIDNVEELELPDEPYSLGFQYLPLDPGTTQKILETIALPQ